MGRVTEDDLDEAAVYIIRRLNRILFVEDTKKALADPKRRVLRSKVEYAGRTYQIPAEERDRICRALKEENPQTDGRGEPTPI